MKTKFLKHQKFRIAVMAIVALAFSLMLFTVLITLGFSRYSSIKSKDYEVSFLGMPIL